VITAATSRWQRVDVLVNNAGAIRPMPLAHTTAEGINHQFDLLDGGRELA